MTVKEVMERLSITETGRAVAYIKDGLEEIEMYTKENVLSGKKGSLTTSNTISFNNVANDDFIDINTWSGASLSAGDTTLPTDWSLFDAEGGATAPEFRQVAGITGYGLQILNKHSSNLNNRHLGVYKTITVIPGLLYNVQLDINFSTAFGNVKIGTALAIDVADADITSGTGQSGWSTVTSTFTPTASTMYLKLYLSGSQTIVDDIATFDNILIYPAYNLIAESSNLFTSTSNFEAGMKLKVDGSTSNDTDEADNATNGYYTIKERATNSSTITVEEDLNDESISSLNTITLTATNQNFMDIIANKRYYPLPTDMLSLIGVKAKNHQNNQNKYREIPRMIYKPIEQDVDDI